MTNELLKCGYDTSIFVVKPSEQFACALCLNILNDPRQCSNGHSFCFSCISAVLQRKQECPICKVQVSAETLTRNLLVQDLIEGMKTVCISCDDAENPGRCLWKGPLSERQSHYDDDCGFCLITCPNIECGVMSTRLTMTSHVVKCGHQSVSCPHCCTTVSRLSLPRHVRSCDGCPVKCPNKCSARLMSRDLERHLSTECPTRLVDCPLFAVNGCFDCNGKVQQTQLAFHMQVTLKSGMFAKPSAPVVVERVVYLSTPSSPPSTETINPPVFPPSPPPSSSPPPPPLPVCIRCSSVTAVTSQ